MFLMSNWYKSAKTKIPRAKAPGILKLIGKENFLLKT